MSLQNSLRSSKPRVLTNTPMTAHRHGLTLHVGYTNRKCIREIRQAIGNKAWRQLGANT